MVIHDSLARGKRFVWSLSMDIALMDAVRAAKVWMALSHKQKRERWFGVVSRVQAELPTDGDIVTDRRCKDRYDSLLIFQRLGTWPKGGLFPLV